MTVRWKIPPRCGEMSRSDKGGRGCQPSEPRLTEHRSARVDSPRLHQKILVLPNGNFFIHCTNTYYFKGGFALEEFL